MAGVASDHDVDFSNFFDQMDDLLDIPDETCNIDNAESDFLFGEFKDFPSIWTPSDEFAIESVKDVFSENNSNHSASDLSDNLSLPYEDIAQLEWLSEFVEDSFSAGNSLTIDVPNAVPSALVSPSTTQFQTTSPVSVLESSSSSYAGGKYLPVSVKPAVPTGGRCGRARSERPRPPTFNRRLVSPSASFTMGGSSEGESYDEFFDNVKIRKSGSSAEQKKKKRIKLSAPAKLDQNYHPNSLTFVEGEERKCQHCEITKTPQWRAGPNGPKTLCNACGVRYKSGRLFPEYRPAASPTFVPSIHSNSHKKVLEMRVKTPCNMADSPSNEDSSRKNIMADNMKETQRQQQLIEELAREEKADYNKESAAASAYG